MLCEMLGFELDLQFQVKSWILVKVNLDWVPVLVYYM